MALCCLQVLHVSFAVPTCPFILYTAYPAQGGWSLSHSSLGRGRVHPGQVTCLIMELTHMLTHKFIHSPIHTQGQVRVPNSPVNVNVSRRWEESEAPRGNPCRHWESMETTQKGQSWIRIQDLRAVRLLTTKLQCCLSTYMLLAISGVFI